MAALVAYVVPIPFLFLELLVGVIQALIFSILLVVYFTIGSTDHDEHEHAEAKSSGARSPDASHEAFREKELIKEVIKEMA
jgi:hypothetical protein